MKHNSRYKTFLVCVAGLLFSGVTLGADLEEIVVTGLKRESTVMETPSAITALSASDLASKGLSDMRQIQYAVPSLHFGESYHNRNISIRGVGVLPKSSPASSPASMEWRNRPMTQLRHCAARPGTGRGTQGPSRDRCTAAMPVGGAVNFIAASPTEEIFGRG